MNDLRSSAERVADMNIAFGNPKGEPWAINGPRLLRQCQNIGGEFKELMACFGLRVEMSFHDDATVVPEGDVIDHIRDALCDIHVFAYGAHHFMGLDADLDMHEVVSAVMTRFASTPAALEASEEHFKKLGVDYYVEGEFPLVCLKSSRDQQMPEYPKGKFLKAVGHRKPEFYPLPAKPPEKRKFFGMVTDSTAWMVTNGAPASTAASNVLVEMAVQREAGRVQEQQKRDYIDKLVGEYKANLEQIAFGWGPFTDGSPPHTFGPTETHLDPR